MKRICIFLSLLFCTSVFAHTIRWHVDGSVYQTTSCSVGDDISVPVAPEKYGYNFSEWQPEYVFYDYAVFSGTQAIDTGIVFDDNTNEIEYEIKVKDYAAGYSRFFGAASAQNNNSMTNCSGSVHGSWGTWPIMGHANKADRFGSYNPGTSVDRTVFKLIINKNDLYSWFYVDDTLNGTQSLTSTTFSQNSIWLGAAHVDSTSDRFGQYGYRGKIEYFKITKDGVLVGDFVPVKRTADNLVGFYDKVTGNFFANVGSGVLSVNNY